jgi:hypothetical protein
MDMETSRLDQASWVFTLDRDVRRDGSDASAGSASGYKPRPVPMLDWPANLFDDEIVCH